MSRVFSLSETRAPEHLAFAHFAFNRADHNRADAAALDAAFASASARSYLVAGDTIILKAGTPHEPLFAGSELPPGAALADRVFLGFDGDAPRFAVSYDAATGETLATTAGLVAFGLRQIGIERLASPQDLGALGAAKALFNWHGSHRFCSACGQPSAIAHGGWRRDCPSCKAMHFPRTDPVVIMLAVRGEHCLLGRQPRFPQGNYSCLAGFCEPGETIEDAVRREVFEEAGITTARVRYVASQPWAFPNSLMIGAIAEATSDTIEMDVTEMEDVRWFSRDEARAILAGDHPDVRAPASFAIARHILKAWVSGEVGF